MRLIAGESKYHATIHQSDQALPFLLMLHGFLGSQKVFSHLLPQIKKSFNPITIDLAGHGKTETPAAAKNFKAAIQTRQIVSILKRLQFERLVIYGYSMGGRLAFQVITDSPHLFSGAVIESAHCGIASDKERKERRKLDSERANQILSDYRNFANRWSEMPLFDQTPFEYKNVYKSEAGNQLPELMAASLKGFGAGVMQPVCSQVYELNIPIHYIAGSLDNKYVSVLSEINRRTKNSTLHVVPGAGHRVHTDKPENFLKILSEAFQ